MGRPAPFRRPRPEEYPSDYLRYVERVPEGDIVRTLATQVEDSLRLLRGVLSGREVFRPAEDKWSIREVVGHVIDTERVFVYRALSIARADPAALPSMEQDDWARAANAAVRPLADLTDELEAVRKATVLFFAGLDGAAADRRGVANGLGFTVRAFPWIIAGHELHHRTLLREKYGVGS